MSTSGRCDLLSGCVGVRPALWTRRSSWLLLAAYDGQLRTEAEVATATWVDRDGPLFRACFGHGRGFVTYRDLGGFDKPADGPRLDVLIERTIDFFVRDTDVTEMEWKTRGHDKPADLVTRLLARGLVPDERETVMIGTCASLDRPVELPPGVRVRRLGVDEHGGPSPVEQVRSDLVRALTMQATVFGGDGGIGLDDLLGSVLDPGSQLEFWVVSERFARSVGRRRASDSAGPLGVNELKGQAPTEIHRLVRVRAVLV